MKSSILNKIFPRNTSMKSRFIGLKSEDSCARPISVASGADQARERAETRREHVRVVVLSKFRAMHFPNLLPSTNFASGDPALLHT